MQHLDEGTIHAWLDGQLPREEAAEVEAHVAECRQCADAVAEARGLIAASSRILTALDSVPGEVVPKQASFRAEAEAARANAIADAAADALVPLGPVARRAHRRWFNAASLAAAAAIVVAIGTVTLMQRSGKDMISTVAERAIPARTTPRPAMDTAAVVGAPLPQATSVPAPTATKSLGDARRAIVDRQVAAAPSNARDEREASNELARPAVSDSASERVALRKEAESRALYGTPAGSSAIRIRGQSALRAETTAATIARPDTGRADRSQQVAADAAKTVAAGVVKGRVTDANNTGLANVMVTLAGTKTGVATNAEGEFTLAGVQSGPRRLDVRRIGYESVSRDITVAAAETLQTDIVLSPARTELGNVVVTSAATEVPQAGARAKAPAPRPAAPPADTPPGAPITAAQSNAVGCYELGITPLTASRNAFRQVPRRVALDSEIVPANADGVWYRARDVARTNQLSDGLWRPTGPDAIELEWVYGSRTARIRVSGPAGYMMRGNLEEIDRARATGEAANVVAVRQRCEP